MSLGRGRSLAAPAFPGDDGAPDAQFRRLLAAGDAESALAAFPRIRVFGAVLAVADEVGEDGSDKSSHMAVVSMVNARGETGLLAFTGIDSLQAWDPRGRPVPAWGVDAARAALEDGAQALVLDVAGPFRLAVPREALERMVAEHGGLGDEGPA